MSKVKKAKEHKFLNKHTILGVFLLMYFNIVLINFVIGSAFAIICEHAGIDPKIGLGAGAGEEVAFREVGISYLARQWKDENKIIMMAIIPAAAFALTHLTNIVTMSFSCAHFCAASAPFLVPAIVTVNTQE